MAEPVDKNDKPIRVMEGEVVVARCPLCTKPITATVEVEVRLGALTIGKAVDEETGAIPVDVTAEPRLRKLSIEHECKAPAVRPRTRKPRAVRTPGSAPPAAPEAPPIPIVTEPEPGEPVYEECAVCGKSIDRYAGQPWFHVDVDSGADHDAVYEPVEETADA